MATALEKFLAQSDRDLTVPFLGYGDQRWYNQEGELHREGDLPAVIYEDGSQFWLQNGKFHRDEDQPAVVTSTTQAWFKDNFRHRISGPAFLRSFLLEGEYLLEEEYYLEGVKLTPKEWEEERTKFLP